jgi:hypothetical protein
MHAEFTISNRYATLLQPFQVWLLLLTMTLKGESLMSRNDRNQTEGSDRSGEPNRNEMPGDRQSKPAPHPGGYGPAQGEPQSPRPPEKGKRELEH